MGALTVRENHGHLEEAVLPNRLLLARNAALPDLEVQHALRITLRPRVEAEGVVLSPLLPAQILGQRSRRRLGAHVLA